MLTSGVGSFILGPTLTKDQTTRTKTMKATIDGIIYDTSSTLSDWVAEEPEEDGIIWNLYRDKSSGQFFFEIRNMRKDKVSLETVTNTTAYLWMQGVHGKDFANSVVEKFGTSVPANILAIRS